MTPLVSTSQLECNRFGRNTAPTRRALGWGIMCTSGDIGNGELGRPACSRLWSLGTYYLTLKTSGIIQTARTWHIRTYVFAERTLDDWSPPPNLPNQNGKDKAFQSAIRMSKMNDETFGRIFFH